MRPHRVVVRLPYKAVDNYDGYSKKLSIRIWHVHRQEDELEERFGSPVFEAHNLEVVSHQSASYGDRSTVFDTLQRIQASWHSLWVKT